MDNGRRARSKKLEFSRIAILAIVASATGIAHADSGESPRTISVTGRGEVSVKPDRAILSLSVETTAKLAASAAGENARVSSAVAKAVGKLIGAEDEVTTSRYSLQPRYDHSKTSSKPHIAGYVASNQVRVETGDVENVGKLIDAAIEAGANRIESLQFDVEDRATPGREALARAAADARAQAAAVASGLGVRLGSVRTANSSSNTAVPYRAMEGMALAKSAHAATPVGPGSVDVSATVSVTYDIE